ncbi:MAG: glutathione transport system permease protein [Gaiellaceae bacterium]|jgi:peptide/nickel transport system permease protein|nr:glutathione transport system permease protein [Gaiellaceae bacterium]MDX6470423.1 glutathione transport system permease protein [Gaiellaceae bacterium]MDX6471849.1 glutathione transport system permease protein [Gaiellaceae bacterium]
MLTYILRRLLYSIPVLILSTFLSFVFVSLAGDPRQNLLANPKLSHENYNRLFHTYHLDASIPVRYWYWVQDVFTHKLGSSLLTSQAIWPDITRVMGHTIQIIGLAEIIALVLGVAVGIFSAIKQYSVFDYLFTSVSFLGFAMPTFWLALLLQILFVDIYLSWHVRIFYTSGLNSGVTSNTWSLDRLQHIALPVMTLAIISFALYSRYMRAAMLDVISTDYVRTARAKGLPERLVIMRHVFRNALIPIVTITALNLGALLGGAIVTETVFSLDGMGYYFITKLGQLDVYAVMAYLAITAAIIILFNLIADILYGYLDPRIRYD